MRLMRRCLLLLLLLGQGSLAEVVIVAAEPSPVLDKLAALVAGYSDQPTRIADSYRPAMGAHHFLVGEPVIQHWPDDVAATAVLTSRQIVEQYRLRLQGAIYLEPPLARQMDLIQSILPSSDVAVIYGPSVLPWAWPELSILEENGAQLVRYQPGQSLNYALKDALRGNDVLLGINDPDIYNPQSIKNILISAYRQNIPLVGPGRAYIRAGAIASTYSSLDDIARRMADVVLGRITHAFDYNPYFSVAYNEQVARSLNISLPMTDAAPESVE